MTEAEIIARLEKATGGDLELDGLIAKCFGEMPSGARWVTEDVYGGQVNQWASGGYGSYEFYDPPAYTASIDAAVALVEKVMPGWGYYLRSDKEGHGCGLVYPDAPRVTPCHCMGATPAIAILLALFKARALAQGE